MNKTIDWVNAIIDDLVDPNTKLRDVLLKVQVLAFKINNEKLKLWANNEMNGYVGMTVPKYRILPTVVFGNITQNRGLGMLRQTNVPLPIEYLNEEYRDELSLVSLDAPVSSLEHMVDTGSDHQINIPHIIHREISKIFANNWNVDSAWKKITINSVEGVISAIKSNLLTFLLELASEIGENENLDIVGQRKKIDSLFNKTIGNISGENIYVSLGSDNIQSINTGDNPSTNIAVGENINQKNIQEANQDLASFVLELKSKLDDFGLSLDDKEDVRNELARIEAQLKKEKPKYSIINGALKTVHEIFISVAGNVLTSPVVPKLVTLIDQFSQVSN